MTGSLPSSREFYRREDVRPDLVFNEPLTDASKLRIAAIDLPVVLLGRSLMNSIQGVCTSMLHGQCCWRGGHPYGLFWERRRF